jgi:polyphosphate:AMP phosphotransferase
MFESAELGQFVDKSTYQRDVTKLRSALLAAQRDLANSDLAVVIIIAGVAGAGKSETVNLLLEWLDARGIRTHSWRGPTDEETERPHLWRFWRDLPPRGRMGIFFGAWSTGPLHDFVFGQQDRAQLDHALDEEVALERMLHREQTLVVKFWLHLSESAQRKRLKKLQADPETRWQVTKQDRKQLKHYGRLRTAAEHVLRRTDTAEAPWSIVESTDKRFRNLTVARTLLTTLQQRLEQIRGQSPPPAPKPLALTPPTINVINRLDLTQALDPAEAKRQLRAASAELNRLTRYLRKARRSMSIVFEGPDAAGKGGAIRRLTSALDARDYQVISVAAPTDEERSHPYLWRFWRHLPRRGKVSIYDRSWYGRVLVERVEGFARVDEWQRAYEEINAFEEQLTDFGTIVMKFWLAISPEEQLQRFRDRQETPYKQYKITPEDWRNRAKWDAYEAAACDMIERTGSAAAPWILVEAENKDWARVKVMNAVIQHLQTAFARKHRG